MTEKEQVVMVRVAVAVDPLGNWSAAGWSVEGEPAGVEAMGAALDGILEGEARYWLTAELAVPCKQERIVVAGVEGELETGGQNELATD